MVACPKYQGKHTYIFFDEWNFQLQQDRVKQQRPESDSTCQWIKKHIDKILINGTSIAARSRGK